MHRAPLRPLPTPLPPRPRRRWVHIAFAAVVCVAAVTLVPTFLLSRAELRAEGCFADIIKRGDGDPQGCLPQPYELALARRLPWLARDAVRVSTTTGQRAAVIAYDLATCIKPSATARKEAFAAVVASQTGALGDLDASLTELDGAFAELIELGLESDDKELRAAAFGAARATAALEPLERLSGASDASEPARLNLRRGALLCLVGERALGVRALGHANEAHRATSDHGDDYGLASLALLACGQGADTAVDARNVRPEYRPALAALDASFGTIEALDRLRALFDGVDKQLIGEHRLRLLPSVVGDTLPPLVEALALIAPSRGPAARLDLDALRTPWTLLDAGDLAATVLVDPPAAARAALTFEELARLAGTTPLQCVGPECPVAVALSMPQPLFTEAARMLWLEAATEFLRRGGNDAALEAARRALALTPPRRRHQSAALFLAAGDPKAALATLEPQAEGGDPGADDQTVMHINAALAFMHQGKLRAAYREAELGYAAAAAALDAPSDDEPVPIVMRRRDEQLKAAAWLWAALALPSDKGREVAPLLKDAGSGPAAEWLELALLDEPTRKSRRWGLALRDIPSMVVPAAMYLAAGAVPADAEVEVWLDRVFSREHERLPLRSMLARAEAARWRGDRGAERLWAERATRVRKLIVDYRSALLAQLVELR
jgi:hypothetical protein